MMTPSIKYEEHEGHKALARYAYKEGNWSDSAEAHRTAMAGKIEP